MGIGSSREWYGQRQQKPSLSSSLYGSSGGNKYRRGIFRRRTPSVTIQAILSTAAQPTFHRPLYGSYPFVGQVPAYAPLQPISSPYLSIPYNNFPASPYIPLQSMMMLPQPVAPYMASPPMAIPYMQQAQIQPAYNNIGVPAPIPAGMSGGPGYYPSSYPSAPARVVTDWTGGGQISPGFLGPPI